MTDTARRSHPYSLAVATTSRLPEAEQQSLAERYAATRSPEDKRRLVLANLRLVLAIARRLGAGRPDRAAEARDELRRLRDALARLEETMTARDRAILHGRLLCEEPVPLRRFGPRVGLSGERVRQLERDLLTRLRTYIGAYGDGEARRAA